ncbi:MAG: TauD/TfdA family dioxygenase [Alphaproteobacteria bacterium]|nr:TauD/TfdA family dioxygenase [Alphaproteobacteria bacterium]
MLIERPLTGTIGAEIEGVDLKQPISSDLAGELRDALDRRLVVFFRDQFIDVAQQKVLTRVFGPLARSTYIEGMPDDPFVIRVIKEAYEGGGVFGGDWHSDLSFLEQPPGGSVLNAVEVPPYGGDTLWASQVAAYEALPPDLRTVLDGRDAVHVGKPHGVKWAPPMETRMTGAIRIVRDDPTADEERSHPAVLTHPVTGRRSVYVNPIYVTRLDGMTEEESRPLLDRLRIHCIRPEFFCRFRWTAGTVAVWDNYSTLHYAVNDYAGFRRLMMRTTFSGRAIAEWRRATS